MQYPNVVGVGKGYKFKNGKQTKKKAILVFVKKKLPEAELRKNEVIPKKLGRLPTDVIEVGEVKALGIKKKSINRKSRVRPAPGGVSIGHYKITAGTLGCLVFKEITENREEWVEAYDHELLKWFISWIAPECRLMQKQVIIKKLTVKKPFILSNNHVLANCDMNDMSANIGDPILQPGPYDGGRVSFDTIAELKEWIPLQKSHNLVDAALAEPLSPFDVTSNIIGIGAISGTASTAAGNILLKSGRTTGLTKGTVIATEVTIGVNYGEKGVLYFDDQIMTTCMSKGGDSGSLMVDEQNRAVGLLFAGSDKVTLANKISNVVNALNIDFKL